jgi:ABC-type transporter Mla subunit MlaD
MTMDDSLPGLTELRAQIDDARGQLERARTQLAAASTANPDVAETIRSALDDIVAVGQRIARLQHTISEQIDALSPPLRCSRCRSEMRTPARRCSRCSAPIAQA